MNAIASGSPRCRSFRWSHRNRASRLKTAPINHFVRDMPRLSVDIDLTYVPVADRAIENTAQMKVVAVIPEPPSVVPYLARAAN